MRRGLAALLTVCLLALPAEAGDPPAGEPSGAWRWSLVLPGIGQMVLGEPLRGTGFLMGALLLPVLGYTGVHVLLTPDQPSAVQGSALMDEQTLMVTGIGVALALAGGIWTWAAFDAYHLDLDKHRPQPEPATPEPTPTPEPSPVGP